MAVWEPEVQNYLGFPDGVSGEGLLENGRRQAERYGVEFREDMIDSVTANGRGFDLRGNESYRASRVLLATGIYHIPPDIPGVKDCLGHSMFFCKDCDGLRVRGKRVVVFGNNNETVEYALGMLHYTACVMIVLHGKKPAWDQQHQGWIKSYEIPVFERTIVEVCHEGCELQALSFEDDQRVEVDALFTTRGDIFYNKLAKSAGAEIDATGEVQTDSCLMTTVPGLYAAGCVTAANCQMIIAAGQGAIAGQAINRSLFEESLGNNKLRQHREEQIEKEKTEPDVVPV